MTDRLELAIRDHLRAEAAYAPAPDGLATGAVALAHRRRRRAARQAGTALAVVLALGGTALAFALPRTPATPVTPPITSPTPTDRLALDGTLAYRGTSVRVPKTWLDPENVRCGTALRDAAYVLDKPGSCHPQVDRPERISEVVLAPWADWSTPPPTDPDGMLADGRTQLTTRVPVSDLRLVVTSPDRALARRIFDSLTVAGECDGGYWLEASNGRAAVVGSSNPTLLVHVGDTITLHASDGCAVPRLSATDYDILSSPDGEPGPTLVAIGPGVSDADVGQAMCDGVPDPTCLGGYALYGTVRVTVVAAPTPSR